MIRFPTKAGKASAATSFTIALATLADVIIPIHSPKLSRLLCLFFLKSGIPPVVLLNLKIVAGRKTFKFGDRLSAVGFPLPASAKTGDCAELGLKAGA